jgi:large subunit ribosomal protein L17
MNHSNKNKQLGRKMNERNALLKTMAVSFVKYGKITTTETKAKVLKTYIEKLITKGKQETVTAQRLIATKVGVASARKIVKEIAPKYKTRNGGYLRVIKIKTRLSDSARMAVLELV